MTIIPRAVWILVLSCAAAYAQTSTAQFKDTVKEPSGLPLAGAEVKVTETATAAVRTMVTGADGEFSFVGLRSETYTLEISKPGFEMFVQSGVVLREDATVTLDAALKQQTTPSSGTTVPSLGDLGFSPVESQGSAQDQARLDRRSRMLKTHQRLGLITLAPMLARQLGRRRGQARHCIRPRTACGPRRDKRGPSLDHCFICYFRAQACGHYNPRDHPRA